MLFLQFELGQQRYALDAGQVAEVLPLVRLRPLLHAPRGLAGLLNYRGTLVPVVDLSEVTLDRPTPAHLTTRIVLVTCPDAAGSARLLGLIAEHATDTLRREPADFVASGVGRDGSAAAGRITTDERGVIQWLELGMLLPDTLRDALFAPAGGA
jgi:chemotaxis-related protein WspB